VEAINNLGNCRHYVNNNLIIGMRISSSNGQRCFILPIVNEEVATDISCIDSISNILPNLYVSIGNNTFNITSQYLYFKIAGSLSHSNVIGIDNVRIHAICH